MAKYALTLLSIHRPKPRYEARTKQDLGAEEEGKGGGGDREKKRLEEMGRIGVALEWRRESREGDRAERYIYDTQRQERHGGISYRRLQSLSLKHTWQGQSWTYECNHERPYSTGANDSGPSAPSRSRRFCSSCRNLWWDVAVTDAVSSSTAFSWSAATVCSAVI